LAVKIGADEIYGPALKRAYHLENRIARSPRILIGDELWNYLNQVEAQAAAAPFGRIATALATSSKKLVTTDEDGCRILDILGDSMAVLWPAESRGEIFRRAYHYVIDQQQLWNGQNERLHLGYARLIRGY